MRITLTVEVDPVEWRAEYGPCDDLRTAVEIYLFDKIAETPPFGGSPPLWIVRLSGKPV